MLAIFGPIGASTVVADLASTATDANCLGVGWIRNSVFFFDEANRYFLTRLACGRLLATDLYGGVPFDLAKEHKSARRSKLYTQAQESIKRYAIDFLSSKNPIERQTGAIICGQERITDAAEGLRKLLEDDSYYLINQEKVFYVQVAARTALEKIEAGSAEP